VACLWDFAALAAVLRCCQVVLVALAAGLAALGAVLAAEETLLLSEELGLFFLLKVVSPRFANADSIALYPFPPTNFFLAFALASFARCFQYSLEGALDFCSLMVPSLEVIAVL